MMFTVIEVLYRIGREAQPDQMVVVAEHQYGTSNFYPTAADLPTPAGADGLAPLAVLSLAVQVFVQAQLDEEYGEGTQTATLFEVE